MVVMPYTFHPLVFYTDTFSMYHFTVKTSHTGAVYLQQGYFIATVSDFRHKPIVIFCRLSSIGDCII